MSSPRPFSFLEARGKQSQYHPDIGDAFGRGMGLAMKICLEYQEI